MQLSQIPELLPLPFADDPTGRRTIPEASVIDSEPGRASFETGFPPLTRTPISAGGIPPAGLDVNGILFRISEAVRWANAGGGYTYDNDFANNVSVNGYPIGAQILNDAGDGYWLSIENNNTTDPNAGGSGWVPAFNYGSVTIPLTSLDVTLTATQYNKPLIIFTGILTDDVEVIFPDIIKEWTLINNTTGDFSITAKTLLGDGVFVARGLPSPIVCDGSDIYSPVTSLQQMYGEFAVNNTTELRMLPPPSLPAGKTVVVTVLGYSSAGDGGGGQFYWQANSNEADNLGLVIIPNSLPATGRWKRAYSNGTVDVKWFGVTALGTGNQAPAINYVLSVMGANCTILFSRGVYRTEEEILNIYDRVNLVGEGTHVTRILFMPNADASCITFKKTPGSPVNQSSVKNLNLWSDDSTYVKVGLDLYDTSICEFSNISIGGSVVFSSGGYWRDTATASSIGINTHGRDTTVFDRIHCYADKPIVISPLLSSGIQISADHFNFNNLYLSAAQNPLITVQAGCVLTQVSFTGYQAWVGGTDGFYWVDATTPGVSNGLYFANVRREGSTDPTKYAFQINPASGLQGLTFIGGQAGVCKGFYLRNCQNVLFDNFYYTDNSREALNVDASVYPITCQSAYWQTGSTASITGLVAVLNSPNAITMPVITDGIYTLASVISYNYEVNATQGETSVTLANLATMSLGSNTQRGFVLITTSVDVSAIFCLKGPTAATVEVSDPDGFFSTVPGTSGFNVYWSGANNRYELENNTGVSRTVKIMRIGTGQGF